MFVVLILDVVVVLVVPCMKVAIRVLVAALKEELEANNRNRRTNKHAKH